jgi:hypothetical protein
MRLSLLSLLLLTATTTTPASALPQRAADDPADAGIAPEPRSEPPTRAMRPFGRGEDAPGVRAAKRTERMEPDVEFAQPHERRGRARDIPPSAGSPVFGSAVPSPVTVTRAREVSPGSVAAGNLRDRIAAEGLRRDRIESEKLAPRLARDRRYDWRRYRDRDRSRFHLGIYIDPFGWRYRDYDIGCCSRRATRPASSAIR